MSFFKGFLEYLRFLRKPCHLSNNRVFFKNPAFPALVCICEKLHTFQAFNGLLDTP